MDRFRKIFAVVCAEILRNNDRRAGSYADKKAYKQVEAVSCEKLLAMLPVTALTALVYLALSLPLLFKFGLEKGRIFFLLLTAAFVVFGGVLLGWLGLSA